jgi:apolipoprotein N-acyltransferase
MMKRAWNHKPRAGTLLSALLIVIAHPPLELHAAIWIGVIPWLLTIHRCESWREALVQGFWLNFLLGLGGAFWVAYAVPQYLGVSGALGFVAMILHAAIHQLQIVAFAPFFHWISTRKPGALGPAGLLLAAFLYTGLDWIIPNLFRDTFGFVLNSYPFLSQLAEFGGASVLTFLVLTANLCLFSVATLRADTNGRPASIRYLQPIALLTTVMVGCSLWGAHRYRLVSASIAAPVERIRVGVVQGNVSDEIKKRWARGDPDAAREALAVYIRASAALLERLDKPDLIVWPETAYPGIFRRPENEQQAALNVALDRYIATTKTPFVFGGYDREDRSDRRVLRNAIFFVEPKPGQSIRELSPMQVYHKHILFPVGEYLPLFSENFLRRWLPNSGAFSTGEGARVYDVAASRSGHIRIGPSICYEDLFPEHSIALARDGAQLIVNVSNDSWFGNYGLPQFHLIAAKLRSIETRLPQIRATNTGYSALILPNGDAIQTSEYGSAESMIWEVPLIERYDTAMVRGGDWFGAASLMVSLGGLLVQRMRAAEGRGRRISR